MTRQESRVAVALEVVPGIFQTFGIGHLYAGKTGTGIALMFGYWALQAINAFFLPFFAIFTGPLLWLAFMFVAPTNVMSSDARR